MKARYASLLVVLLLLLGGSVHAITPAGTIITNVARINYQSSNGLVNYEAESNPAQTQVSGVSQLSITKSGPAQTVAGAVEGLTYTIVVSNQGSSPETNLEVVDVLPPQVTFEEASQNGVFSNGQVRWTGLSLAPGESLTLTVRVSTDPGLPAQVIVNRAHLVRQGETIPSNPVETQVLQQLVLQKTGVAENPGNEPRTSQRGGVIDYTLTCTNPNPVTIHDVRLIDTLPSFTEVVQISAGGSLNDNQVIWVVGDLAPNASQLVQLSLRVRNDAPIGVLTNIVTATSDELDDVVAQADFGIVEAFAQQPSFDFLKRVDKSVASAGEELTYTVTLENVGDVSLQNVVVSDALDPLLSYVAGSASGDGTYDTEKRTLSWGPIPEVGPGTLLEFSFRARVEGPIPATGAQVQNVALLRSQRILDTPSNTVTTDLRGEPLRIELVADPEVILGDGVTTSLLTATVHKVTGALADDGTPVTFTTTRGIFTNGNREIQETTLNGIATVQLRSEVISGSPVQAKVIAATGDDRGGQVTDQTTVTFAPAAIVGVVTDWSRNNAPVVGARVSVAGNIVDAVVTDINGRYLIPVVQSAKYTLGILTTDALGSKLALLEPVEVQASVGRTFSPKNAIAGIVLNADTAQPISGAMIRVLRDTQVVRDNIPTDANGRYIVTGLEAANYQVELAEALEGFDTPSISVNLTQTGQTMINANLSLTRLPSLRLEKIVNRSVAFPGDELTYTIAYNNAGGEARNVIITDRLPAGTIFLRASQGGVLQGDTVSWSLPSIPAGGSGSVEVTVEVANDLTDKTRLENTAMLTFPGQAEPLTASASTLIRQVVLNIVKNASVAQVQPGGEITYTIAYANAGGRPATDVTVRDTLPSGATLVQATQGATQIGQTLLWQVGTLPPGATQTLQVTLRLAETFRNTQVTNTATVQANEVRPVSASTTVNVVFTPMLTVEKRADRTQAQAGDEILYTIVYQNAGRIDATGLRIIDHLPSEVEYLSGGDYNPTTHVVTWDVGRLIANSAPQSVTVRVKVLPNAAVSRIVNTAEVQSNEAEPITAQVTVDLLPTVQVSKRVDKTTVKSGEQLTYTLQVVNQGGPATNAVLRDPLPGNTKFVNATGDPTVEDNVVTWNLGQVEPQANRSYTLVVRVAEGLPSGTVIENQGSFHSDQVSVNTQVIQTTVQNPNLELEKVAATQIQPGASLTYTIRYRNTGDAEATGVVITDTIPANTRYVRAVGVNAPEVSGSEPGSTVIWRIGEVPPGGGGNVELVVEVDPSPGSATIENTATIESQETPPTTATVQTQINIQTGLTLEKEALDAEGQRVDTALTGEILTYRFNYQNLGNVIAKGVVITDTLPEKLTYVDGGRYDARTRVITLEIGDLPPGSSGSVSFRAQVASNLSPQIHEVTNAAQIEDESGETTEDTWTVYAMPPFLKVSLVGDRRVMSVGESTALVIHIENPSVHDLTDVEVSHTLPRGFVYVPGTSLFDGVAIPDPAVERLADGKTRLTWTQGADQASLAIPANSKHKLVFRARLTQDPGRVFSVEHVASAQGKTRIGTVTEKQVTVVARPNAWRLRIRRELLAGEGIILGKVFVDKDNDREQDADEPGFPNARLLLEDGRIVITDEYGKYSIPEVEPGVHVIKLDLRSIPDDYAVVRHTTRAAGDPTSQFLDVPAGAVEKADFILQQAVVEEAVTSRGVPVPTVEVVQPKLGAFAPPIIPEVVVEQPQRQRIETPVAPVVIEQPTLVQVQPPPPEPVSTPVRMPSIHAPLMPPQVNIVFKPDRIPAGDPKIFVTADRPLTKVVAVHPDGRKIILKREGNTWWHHFTVPFETPEGPYPFVVWVTDEEGRAWYNLAVVTVDNSIPNVYAEFVPKVLKPGQQTTLKVTLLIEARSVSINLRNGIRLKLKRDRKFHWSTTYTIPKTARRGWHNGEITVIAREGHFKQRAIVAYKVE